MKKTLIALILLFGIIGFANINAQTMDKDAACLTYKKEAMASIKSGKMVYKRFGMPISLVSKEAQQYLRKNYQLEIIQMGCIINPGEQCYNGVINDFLKEKYGKYAHELIDEATEKTK